jgi:hypothetical protein
MSTSVAEGGMGVFGAVAEAVFGGSGVPVALGAKTVSSRGVAFTLGLISAACDSKAAVSVASSVRSSRAIETVFPSAGVLRTSLPGTDPALIRAVPSCPFGGAFLLNHSNDATADTSAKSSPELEWAHEFRPCDNDSGRLATHSHGTTGGFASPGTMSGSLSAYTCEFVFSEWAGSLEGKGDVDGPGTPSSKRARRERLSALRARTPVKHCRSVVPSKHCKVPCSPETTTPSLPSILCVGADSLKATRGKWSGLSAKRELVPGTRPTKAVSSSE